jgi:hypothetical protein
MYIHFNISKLNILRFLKNEVCIKELRVHDTVNPDQRQEADNDELVLYFYPNTEENFDLLLCTLHVSKETIFVRRDREEQRNPLVS